MHLDWWTIGLQIVNFAILVWLLQRFLYSPVRSVIEARKVEVQRQFDSARAAEDSAKARLAEIETERAAIAAERDAALKAAGEQAREAADAQRAQARREADAILEQARKALSDERKQARDEVCHAALDLGAEFARRLVTEIPAQLWAEVWIDRIEQYIQGLPKPDVEALARQLTNGVTLTVLTASPLSLATTDSWRDRLRRALTENAEVAFETKPELIVGAELHFPNTVLRFSWQSMLAAVRPEFERHDDTR